MDAASPPTCGLYRLQSRDSSQTVPPQSRPSPQEQEMPAGNQKIRKKAHKRSYRLPYAV